MSGSNYCFLTCIQISQEAGKVVWCSYLLENFPQFVVIHTVKGFGVVNKAEVDVFLKFSCFFNDKRVLAIWSLVPLPFLNPAWTSGSSWFTYCWSLAWRILSNCVVVWTFFGFALLWDWNENLPFQPRGHCRAFQICWHTERSIFFNLFFYWRIIALQNVVFYQTSNWISLKYTYIPSLLNLPSISLHISPLQVDTEPLFEFFDYTANSHWVYILNMTM